MAYSVVPSREYEKAVKGLKKRHSETHKQLMLKIERILQDPYHSGHPLRSKYKGLWEAHIQNNLLIYRIIEASKSIELVTYIDHDML